MKQSLPISSPPSGFILRWVWTWSLCCCAWGGYAQIDTSDIDYIYVGRAHRAHESVPQAEVKRDFFRKKVMYRLSFDVPQN
ncbi:MAG: hypothetical protein AAFR59_19175, partial [Bacteroidota bacterium]